MKQLVSRSIIFIVTFIFFSLTYTGCEKSVDPPVKNPREYTWKIDTLAYTGSYQTSMRDIWASSPQDAWIVGHNDQPGPGTMFHFDGKSWKTTGFHAAEGGTVSGPVSLSAIYGFSANNIFAVGERIYQNPKPPPNFLDSSLIIHFDGQQWREQTVSGGRRLLTVWGITPTDAWAGGQHGTLFHFNGSRWQRELIDSTIHIGTIFGFSSADVYAVTGKTVDKVQPLDSLGYVLLHYDGTRWSTIDTFIAYPGYPGDRFGYSDLWGSSPSAFYSVSQGIFEKSNGSWQQVLNTGKPFYGVFGSKSTNIFAVGMDSQVYHYNGSDWFRFPQFSGLDKFFSSVWTDGKEVFVVGNNGRITYILHGK